LSVLRQTLVSACRILLLMVSPVQITKAYLDREVASSQYWFCSQRPWQPKTSDIRFVCYGQLATQDSEGVTRETGESFS